MRRDHPALLHVPVPEDTLELIVRRVVEEALNKLAAARATIPDRLAYGEAEAAALLGLKTHQLRDERLRGRIRASAGPGGRILYRREDLVGYLASRPWEEHQRQRMA